MAATTPDCPRISLFPVQNIAAIVPIITALRKLGSTASNLVGAVARFSATPEANLIIDFFPGLDSK
jgi:hypothetical protein